MVQRGFDRTRACRYALWFVVLGTACGGNSTGGGGAPSSGYSAEPSGGGVGDAAARLDVPSVPSGSDDASVQPPDATGAPSGSDAADDASEATSGDGATACSMTFPSVTDFGSKGSFDVAIDCSPPTSVTADGTGCAVYHPTVMGQGGLKHPVIVWGNGTGSPSECSGDAHVFGEYDYLFDQWASQGFIIAVANTASTGSGTDMLDCLDWVEAQNSVAGSIYEGVIDVDNYGASGHSQGGASAINVGEDPRIRATVPFMPYTVNGGFSYDDTAPTKQHGPMFLGSGGMDTIATPSTNQQPIFDASTVPTFWGTLLSADHVTFAGGSQTDWLAPSTAWFRLFLMCDQSAQPMFYGTDCTLCSDSKWTVQRKNM
jgi:hypothetical protein